MGGAPSPSHFTLHLRLEALLQLCSLAPPDQRLRLEGPSISLSLEKPFQTFRNFPRQGILCIRWLLQGDWGRDQGHTPSWLFNWGESWMRSSRKGKILISLEEKAISRSPKMGLVLRGRKETGPQGTAEAARPQPIPGSVEPPCWEGLGLSQGQQVHDPDTVLSPPRQRPALQGWGPCRDRFGGRS